MARMINDIVEESYNGELEQLQNIVVKLSEIFPKVNWDIGFESCANKFQIIVYDFEFYMKDKSFRNWTRILNKKYPKVKFFCMYRSN